MPKVLNHLALEAALHLPALLPHFQRLARAVRVLWRQGPALRIRPQIPPLPLGWGSVPASVRPHRSPWEQAVKRTTAVPGQ